MQSLARWFPFLNWPKPTAALPRREFWAGLTVGLLSHADGFPKASPILNITDGESDAQVAVSRGGAHCCDGLRC